MKNYYKINERISAPKLRVIGNDGSNLGEMSTPDAVRLARQDGLDLVLIVENANPPVGKILDFKKYLYEEKKKSSSAKAKSKKSELKEFRFGPNIGKGDFDNRVERAKEFIGENHRVQVTVQLKGREQAHPQIAYEKLEEFKKNLEDIARTEGNIKQVGGNVMITFIRK